MIDKYKRMDIEIINEFKEKTKDFPSGEEVAEYCLENKIIVNGRYTVNQKIVRACRQDIYEEDEDGFELKPKQLIGIRYFMEQEAQIRAMDDELQYVIYADKNREYCSIDGVVICSSENGTKYKKIGDQGIISIVNKINPSSELLK